MNKFNLDKAVTDIVKYQQIQIKGKGKNMNDVKEQELKKTIKHFIQMYTYFVEGKEEHQESSLRDKMLDVLDNYIDSGHYKFSPFKEIK